MSLCVNNLLFYVAGGKEKFHTDVVFTGGVVQKLLHGC